MPFKLDSFILLVVATSFASFALATQGGGGVDSRGGGGGVHIGEKTYLLDLYESGRHLNPVVLTGNRNHEFEQALMDFDLPAGTPIELLAKKMTDLERRDPILAAALIEGIGAHSWVLFQGALPPTDDFGQLPPEIQVVQLATRSGANVLIQAAEWQRLDELNRVALILHEVLSSYQEPAQFSNQAPMRRLVSEFFERRFFERTTADTQTELGSLPSLFEASRRIHQENATLPFQAQYLRVEIENFDGVHVPASLHPVPVAKFYFSPWVSLRWDQNGNEMQNPYVRPDLFQLAHTRYCDTAVVHSRLLGLTVSYFELSVRRTSYTDHGSTYPRLEWSMVPRHFMSTAFKAERLGTKANCTAENRLEMSLIDKWGAYLQGSQILLPDSDSN